MSLSAVGGKAVSLSRVALAVPMNASAATSTFQMGLGCECMGRCLLHTFNLTSMLTDLTCGHCWFTQSSLLLRLLA